MASGDLTGIAMQEDVSFPLFTGATATSTIAIGSLFYLNNQLCYAITRIEQGDAFTLATPVSSGNYINSSVSKALRILDNITSNQFSHTARFVIADKVQGQLTASTVITAGTYFLRAVDPIVISNERGYDIFSLYRAVTDIASGDAFVISGAGQNCVAVTIGGELSKAFSNIAPAFDPAERYDVDSYVLYDGVLYRLTAVHAANETWENTSKTAVSVGGEIVNYLPTLFAPAGYGLGDTYGKRLSSSDNLNNITKPGFYTWYGNTKPANAPCNRGLLIASKSHADYGVQIVIENTSNTAPGLYLRSYYTEWKPWYKLDPSVLTAVTT